MLDPLEEARLIVCKYAMRHIEDERAHREELSDKLVRRLKSRAWTNGMVTDDILKAISFPDEHAERIFWQTLRAYPQNAAGLWNLRHVDIALRTANM